MTTAQYSGAALILLLVTGLGLYAGSRVKARGHGLDPLFPGRAASLPVLLAGYLRSGRMAAGRRA